MSLILISIAGIGGVLFLSTALFMKQPKFGKLPTGESLKRIRNSPHYKNGEFKNLSHTPALTEGANFFKILVDYIFRPVKNRIPQSIPSVKIDLHSLSKNEDVMVWFGHSSYFIQIDGRKFLIDPVLSGSASPIPGGTKAFMGSDIYKTQDIPAVDYLVITHDHWDHLDYKTLQHLKGKIAQVICPIGVGSHLEHWGFSKNIIHEMDWHDVFNPENGFQFTATPARHFSGRGFKRNQTLWTAYALVTPTMSIYLGGDSGYDFHFKEIGEKHGPFDLAILENGQYNEKWRYIHTLPAELLLAATELKAKRLFAVHSSKFALSTHSWDEPLELLYQNNRDYNLPLVTPKIGELVSLKDENQVFSPWWRE